MEEQQIEQIVSLLEKCEDLFIGLGDSVRRKLFIDMLKAGEKGINVQTLTANTELSRPAISHHLSVLKNGGMIKARKEGTSNYYYVDAEEHLRNIKEFVQTAEEILHK